MIGTVISHYRLLEKLGEGGMGVVYRAEDTGLLRTVALKLLPDEFSSDGARRKRFLREARTAAALNHPGICTIHEVGEEAGRPFIAMELVPGQTLAARLAAGPLPLPELLRTALEIAEALAEAHAHNIVHRDLKPQNVMLMPGGKAKILDFGLAKPVDPSEPPTVDSERETSSLMSREGLVVGTVPYLSPEQAQGKPVDSRSDVFSFGTVLYEMATRIRPFRGESTASVVARILEAEPESVTALRPELPGDFGRIVRRCLHKRPEDRYNDTKDLVADLKEVRLSATHSAKGGGRRRAVLALVVLTVFAIAGGVLWILQTGLHPRRAAADLTHRQLTFTGKASVPALSQDGRSIAYVDTSIEGHAKVMVQEIGGGQALAVFEAQDCWDLEWSPDGTEVLAWVALGGGQWGGFALPRRGGPSRKVALLGWVAAWSPDGSMFATSPQNRSEIKICDRWGGHVKSIKLKGSYSWVQSLDWSPHGRWIVLTVVGEQQRSALWAVSPETGDAFQLLDDEKSNLASARWAPRGDAIYYLRSRQGATAGLWKLRVAPDTTKPIGPPRLLVGGLQAGSFFTVSRDAKRLLYARDVGYSNLWLVRPDRRAGGHGRVRTNQLTSGTQLDMMPSVSPDGRQIAFSRQGQEGANIFVMPTEGGPEHQLTFRNSINLGSAWSPEGKEIAFGSNEGGTPHVWTVDAAGGAARVFSRSLPSWPNPEIAWSPGRQIIYEVPDHTSFRLLDPVSEEERVFLKRGEDGWVFSPRYSPDGSNVAFSWNRHGAWGLHLVDLGSRAEKMLVEGQTLMPAGWSADGNSIYAVDQDRLDRVIGVPPDGATVQVFMMLPFKVLRGNLSSTTADGRLVASVYQSQSDVWLMEGFDPDLP